MTKLTRKDADLLRRLAEGVQPLSALADSGQVERLAAAGFVRITPAAPSFDGLRFAAIAGEGLRALRRADRAPALRPRRVFATDRLAWAREDLIA